VVYLRLRTVSITLTNTLFDVLEVVGGGGVPLLPSVGISPARIEVDSAHISASAIANRFIVVSSFEAEKCRKSYIDGTRKEWNNKARLLAR
jgi:hypothetical protein